MNENLLKVHSNIKLVLIEAAILEKQFGESLRKIERQIRKLWTFQNHENHENHEIFETNWRCGQKLWCHPFTIHHWFEWLNDPKSPLGFSLNVNGIVDLSNMGVHERTCYPWYMIEIGMKKIYLLIKMEFNDISCIQQRIKYEGLTSYLETALPIWLTDLKHFMEVTDFKNP